MGLTDKGGGIPSNSKISTFLDGLYTFIKSSEGVPMSMISIKHGISIKEAEKWCKLLERQKLIVLTYPPVGEAVASVSGVKLKSIPLNKKNKIIILSIAGILIIFIIVVVYLLI